jgi:CheY-like chemotaxis protein
MCRGFHSVRSDFSELPLGQAKFVAHPPYRKEAVKLELRVLCVKAVEATVINLKIAVRTTLLLVDDDMQQLDLPSLAMKMAGFSVVTASSPIEAISLMNGHTFHKIDVAVIDYHMPVMSGCVLAAYLKARYPDLKIVLCSGALDISEDEMMSVDGFISKSDGVGARCSPRSQVSGKSIPQPPLYSRSRTMLLSRP